jgi:hypothetical protein
MALDDFIDSEVAVAVAATAAIMSPRVRGVLRKGAVYGLAGLLTAGDAIGTFARGVGRGAQQAASSTTSAATATAEQAVDKVEAMAGGDTDTTEGTSEAPEHRTRRGRTERAGGEAS